MSTFVEKGRHNKKVSSSCPTVLVVDVFVVVAFDAVVGTAPATVTAPFHVVVYVAAFLIFGVFVVIVVVMEMQRHHTSFFFAKRAR